MKAIRLFLIVLTMCLLAVEAAQAQSGAPLVLVMKADGAIMPPMLEYIQRGIRTAEERGAEALIIELDTPGGSIATMKEIVTAIRASNVPVIVYVSPRGAWAGSAGAMITMSAHASAMAPETLIGAASPVGGGGEDLGETMKAKEMEALTSLVRSLTTRRGEKVVALAESMITEAKAVTSDEALEAGLIDFVVDNTDDLLEALNGFTVQMPGGPHVLNTSTARAEPLEMSLIERLLLLLTDSNVVFLLLSIGVQAILIELSSPGGWVAGFIGVVCLSLAVYGMGVLPVNWFGLIFLATAFVLFVLDIKAPTHGALTAAGVGSFIVGALVLFNSPGTPQFQQVSVPLVVAVGLGLGVLFFVIMLIALRAQHGPIRMGAETLAHQTGIVRSWVGEAGQVQVESELWSAESAPGSEPIGKGDRVEVVEIQGLRLIVKKK
ncbi:MAG: nodulation protein NfeD [Chloroflexi bacterium]|nr:nodulation protein NfeD [Chloroflexota bacterium]